ncbi:helix-turn-helix domain-containing protein [Williamsia sterculiae]|uniref:Transcriptional regulator, contains XRE-family HTH domain n=1 Tax=Williamsia sterculiae TaxID=1344003 RepID=A0A1N7GKT7_9NOCA|nr:helix-turn-helix transcriptional regulator [Williamsia sterculiae]SIS13108.1 Transcriptional regulator, contains XRE-family HTH domain [Williamsia sterculiae]
MTTLATGSTVGELLRTWRERRRLTQLELSLQVDVSTRHLSYVENGRSQPSSAMILRLTEHLDIPLRERNEILLAGGFAPVFPHHRLDAPALARVADALRMLLDRHMPYPAVVLNRWWDMVDANTAITSLLDGVAPDLLVPPVNVLRLTLHPDGLAPRIRNLGQWRAHLLSQVRQRLERTGDERLFALLDELAALPGATAIEPGRHAVVVPMEIEVGDQVLSLFSMASAPSTATDVTLDELMVETFYPADDATEAALRGMWSA